MRSTWALTFALLAAAPLARADTPAAWRAAEQRFREARAAFDQERFDDALEIFRELQQMLPDGRENSGLWWGIARSLEEGALAADEPERAQRAVEAFDRFIATTDDAENRREAIRRRLTLLARFTTTVQITCPPGSDWQVAVGDASPVDCPATLGQVAVGAQQITVRADDTTRTIPAAFVAGAVNHVAIEAEAAPTAVSPSMPPVAVVGPPAAVGAPASAGEPSTAPRPTAGERRAATESATTRPEDGAAIERSTAPEEVDTRSVRFGARVEAGTSTLLGVDAETAETRFGPSVRFALPVVWRFAPAWALRVEPGGAWTTSGFETAGAEGSEGRWRWWSVELPALVSWRPGLGGLDIVAGPALGYLVDAREGETLADEGVELGDALVARWSVAAHAGLGWTVELDALALRAELRYAHDLTALNASGGAHLARQRMGVALELLY